MSRHDETYSIRHHDHGELARAIRDMWAEHEMKVDPYDFFDFSLLVHPLGRDYDLAFEDIVDAAEKKGLDVTTEWLQWGVLEIALQDIRVDPFGLHGMDFWYDLELHFFV
jgi:hypothetical protein